MGATRLASGIKEKAHTPDKGSQTVLITLMSVSLCLNARRGTRLLKKAKALSFYFYSCVVLLNYSRDTAIFA